MASLGFNYGPEPVFGGFRAPVFLRPSLYVKSSFVSLGNPQEK